MSSRPADYYAHVLDVQRYVTQGLSAKTDLVKIVRDRYIQTQSKKYKLSKIQMHVLTCVAMGLVRRVDGDGPAIFTTDYFLGERNVATQVYALTRYGFVNNTLSGLAITDVGRARLARGE